MKRALVLGLLLGGCQFTASQEREADAQGCSAYYRSGTPAYEQCLVRADQDRQARGAAAMGQIQRNNREANEYIARTVVPPTTTCNSVVNGNTINTACR